MNGLSAEEIAAPATNLADRWQTMAPEQKRERIEIVTDEIRIGKGEITVSFC